MNSSSVINVFLRNPVPGKVKTRLAQAVGDETALKVYLALLEKTRLAIKDLEQSKNLWFDDYIPDPTSFEDWGKNSPTKLIQQGSDLGEKMHNAFLHCFRNGARSAIIIGSDCPGLHSIHIMEAFRILEQNDAVLGPANDGGYYLIGLNQDVPSLFQNMEWSTNRVFAESLERLQWARKHVGILPKLSDLDTIEDLREWESKGGFSWSKNSPE
ncbi:transferase [Leptospira perolatii]|uniref:Transferase n=1 Tax=Leptospira perolatii TaxID=2023191 RepID=A0A2M9ZPY1_9LEPT|nr:TIGR04282 family arsenosugar biosynthesis glycosyltransferase [Leptospira perolatii]PJZ68984.1 transferase [Leptospira perolatii]PJZ74148.1 transferase [Leptospira perolatii]